jgi:mono/diheme cytochrome c family protein
MRNVVSVIVGLIVSSVVLAAQAPDPKLVAQGQALYASTKCGTCHMIAGTGGKSASALDKVGAKLSAAELKMWLSDPAAMEAKLKTKPKVSMAGFMKSRKLSEADMNAIVAYMQTLK